MSAVFYILGWIATLFGGWWVLGTFSQVGSPVTSGMVLGIIIAAAPGFSVLATGLVLLAIGGVLGRLDTIARYSRQSAKTLREILAVGRGEDQEPR